MFNFIDMFYETIRVCLNIHIFYRSVRNQTKHLKICMQRHVRFFPLGTQDNPIKQKMKKCLCLCIYNFPARGAGATHQIKHFDENISLRNP